MKKRNRRPFVRSTAVAAFLQVIPMALFPTCIHCAHTRSSSTDMPSSSVVRAHKIRQQRHFLGQSQKKGDTGRVHAVDLSSLEIPAIDTLNSTLEYDSFSSEKDESRPKVQPRVVGGTDAPRGRYPYMVSLRYGLNHVCGGTLIAPDIILSAAHCAPFFDIVEVGRYDLSDQSEPYRTDEAEIHVVEAFRIHPDYTIEQRENVIDFEQDFVLIKIFGKSRLDPVTLNTNNNVPYNHGDPLTVTGWGIEGIKAQKTPDVLNEVELYYITNNRCKRASGMIDGTFYWGSYSSLITRNVMCAYSPRKDSCQGDSGGPLIKKGATAEDDIQVGIVSSGFGCADDEFPGVYSRISAQYEWIREQVCALSASPPTSFGCPDRPERSEGVKKFVSVKLQFDEFPLEQGYVIKSTDDDTLYAYSPIGSFVLNEPYSTFNEIIALDVNKRYKFVMLDTFGDGMAAQNKIGRYWLYDGQYGSGDVLASGGGYFEFYKEHFFWVGESSSWDVGPTPSPSQPSLNDEGEPFDNNGNFITIVISFDDFPKEVAWVVSDVSSQVVIDDRRYGSYDESYANGEVREVVGLPDRSDADQDYLITILDQGGDGLCCDWGRGYYEIYWGGIEDDDMLFSGKEKYSMDQWLLTVAKSDLTSSSSAQKTRLHVFGLVAPFLLLIVVLLHLMR